MGSIFHDGRDDMVIGGIIQDCRQEDEGVGRGRKGSSPLMEGLEAFLDITVSGKRRALGRVSKDVSQAISLVILRHIRDVGLFSFVVMT